MDRSRLQALVEYQKSAAPGMLAEGQAEMLIGADQSGKLPWTASFEDLKGPQSSNGQQQAAYSLDSRHIWLSGPDPFVAEVT